MMLVEVNGGTTDRRMVQIEPRAEEDKVASLRSLLCRDESILTARIRGLELGETEWELRRQDYGFEAIPWSNCD